MPAAPKDSHRKLRVFLCHASGDKPAVLRLYQRLSKDGMDPWLDQKALLPGQDWRHEIRKAVRSSDVVLVCLSRGSITKQGYVQKEITFALDTADEKPQGTIFLIPVKLQECEVPERLGGRHWTDLFRRGGYNLLKVALRERAEELKLELPVSSSRRHSKSAVPQRATKEPTDVALSPGTAKTHSLDGLEYVRIQAGRFEMGVVPGDGGALAREKPRHPVVITKDFWMTKSPVTVGAYERFAEATSRSMPPAPDFNQKWEKADHPIVRVSWNDAKAYCKWAGGRIPTEAEWEYAERGGVEGWRYPNGSEITKADAHFNASGTSRVGQYPANGYKLLDMAGNVWEWCSDWFDDGYYANSPEEDPRGPSEGKYRVMRGGSWLNGPVYLRMSCRVWVVPRVRSLVIGFRCIREVSP